MGDKATTTKSFFEGRRRAVILSAWSHLKTRAGESRIKLQLTMPLLNHDLQAMPSAVSEAYAVMCQDESAIVRTKLTMRCEGMTMECFATDGQKSPIVSQAGVALDKFSVVAAGIGEKRTVDLQLVAYVPANVHLRDYAWENLHATFYLESTYSQSEMELSDEPVAEDDFEEDEAEDSVAAKMNEAETVEIPW